MIHQGFAFGLNIACKLWSQDQYVYLMEHQGGYMACLKAWHEESSYMTAEEIAIVYDEEKIPPRFFEAFQDFEVKRYNVQIVNHSQFRKE